MAAALAGHDRLLRDEVGRRGGSVVKSTGDGMLATFRDPHGALAAVVALQRALRDVSNDRGIAPARTRRAARGRGRGPRRGFVRQRRQPGRARHHRRPRRPGACHAGRRRARPRRPSRRHHAARPRYCQAARPADAGARLPGRARRAAARLSRAAHARVHSEQPAAAAHARSSGASTSSRRSRKSSPARDCSRCSASAAWARRACRCRSPPRSVSNYPDGVWFVELAPISDARLVPQTVATALGVREEAGRSIQDALLRARADRTLLLVLDNCEHVIDACATLVHQLLQASAGVRILASSRERFNIAGETVHPVPPLAVPTPGRQAPRPMTRGPARQFACSSSAPAALSRRSH